METTSFAVVLPVLAFALGAVLAWFVLGRGAGVERGMRLQLEAELRATRDQFAAERHDINREVRTAVEAAAAGAFKSANDHLLKTANETLGKERDVTLESVKSVLGPLATNLTQVHDGIVNLDKQRLAHAESIGQALQSLTQTGAVLQSAVADTKNETTRLAGALKDNRVRGKWGEISLERAVEYAGMAEHVHYDRQRSQGEGIPDVVVHVPGGGHVPIDAKAPLDAYYEAMSTEDALEQRRLLVANAQALRVKIKDLATRGYHTAPGACGFSLLYVPLESVLAAALSVDPELLEYALEKHVSLASPLTLIPQLRAFAAAWTLHHENVNAEHIVAQAKTLVERLFIVGEHLCKTGKSIETLVKHWNAAVGSFDSRLTPAARNVLELAGRGGLIESQTPARLETSIEVPRRLAELPVAELPAGDAAVQEYRLACN